MGVRGLLSYCFTHQDKCMETFDLVEVARIRGGIEILVDYFSFQHVILRHFWKSLRAYQDNPYLNIIGAEYDTLYHYIVKLVTDLKSLGIELVFIGDAAKGSDPEGAAMKMKTWIKRHNDDISTLNDLLDVCRGTAPARDDVVPFKPILLEKPIRDALQHCNCEYIGIACGEADLRVAKELSSREKAFAIFSSDSDFAIFLGSKFIPDKYFDIENDLHLGEPGDHTEKPARLMVGVFSAKKLMQHLGFVDHGQLIELSIVGGNDYTSTFMDSIRKYIFDSYNRKYIDVYADFVRKYGRVENCPVVQKEIKRNPQMRDAIEYSRKIFALAIDAEQITVSVRRKGPLTTLLEEGIAEGKFLSQLLAVHHNLYWYRFIVEDYGHRYPTVEYVLGSLRSYIYRMVLVPQEEFVTEYGRTTDSDFTKTQRRAHSVEDKQVPSLLDIIPSKQSENLKTFHYIMTHQEPDFGINFFERYGRKTGFTCYLLRYFLVLNWKQNLFLAEEEFLALISLLLGKQQESKYQKMRIRPPPRTVTIINWMQDLYCTAYFYLSKLLYLSHEFPDPPELFSGSVWVAYHTVSNKQALERGVQHFSKKRLEETQQEMTDVIKGKGSMVKDLVEGVFSYDG